jgi:hypothetical protein
VSPVKYELGFYIPEDTILHSHRRENLKSYMASMSYIRFYVLNRNGDFTHRFPCWGSRDVFIIVVTVLRQKKVQ